MCDRLLISPKTPHEALEALVIMARKWCETVPNKVERLDAYNVFQAATILLDSDLLLKSFCPQCLWTGAHPGVASIEDLYDRLMPGRECPTGQCPECGKLTFKQKDAGYIG